MKKRAPKKKGRLLRVLVFLLVFGVVCAAVVYFSVSAWIHNYLRSDACRVVIAQQIGRVAGANCELEPLSWSGANVYSPKISLVPQKAAGWKQIEADGLQATLDWNGVRRGVWSVPSIRIDWLRVALAAEAAKPDVPRAEPAEAEAAPADSSAPAWLKRWLPTRTEIGEADVHTFDLKPSAPGAGVAVNGVHLKAKPAADEGAWQIRGADGKVFIPGMTEPFRLGSAAARVDAKAFVLNDASAHWLGDSEVTARGESPFTKDKRWGYSGRVSNLELRHVLSDDWKPKLSGVIEGDWDVSATPGADTLFKGKLRVKSGVVQGLPVLERVADFTHTERFRRVVLDDASADVEVQGTGTKVTNLALQSTGLLRLEGELLINGRVLLGNFLVGVSPETLRWMPGAQNHVFTEANSGKVPGFVWTHVLISGTLDSPKEDLSNRLLVAMGKAVLLDAPMALLDTGVNILGKTGGSALPGGKGMLDEGKDIIKGAGDTLDKGLDAIKGVVPFFPK